MRQGTPLGWTIYGSENGWYASTGKHAEIVEVLLKAAAVLFIGVMLTSFAGAWEPAAQGVPPAAGLRGPNPIPGLAGLVETPTTGPDAPRFEVASVKRNKNGAGSSGGLRLLAGGGVRNTYATLRMLIRQAYRLSLTDQIIGGPPWSDTRGLAVSPDVPSDPARAPSIFTALQEQLGLRLDAQRGAVDVLAVLSAELPTEN